MSDTQWPRYEVFQQDHPGQPHYNAGSVHAPDAEMALLNARDVFARRPACHSLWVVPAAAIFARTAQELVASGWQANADAPIPDRGRQTFAIFRKEGLTRNVLEHVAYVGELDALAPAQALRQALTRFPAESEVSVWWVCPVSAITRSQVADARSLFDPALDKIYRQPNQYHTKSELNAFRSRQRKMAQE